MRRSNVEEFLEFEKCSSLFPFRSSDSARLWFRTDGDGTAGAGFLGVGGGGALLMCREEGRSGVAPRGGVEAVLLAVFSTFVLVAWVTLVSCRVVVVVVSMRD